MRSNTCTLTIAEPAVHMRSDWRTTTFVRLLRRDRVAAASTGDT